MFLVKGKGLTFPVHLMAAIRVGAGYVYRPNSGDASWLRSSLRLPSQEKKFASVRDSQRNLAKKEHPSESSTVIYITDREKAPVRCQTTCWPFHRRSGKGRKRSKSRSILMYFQTVPFHGFFVVCYTKTLIEAQKVRLNRISGLD